MAQQHLDRLTGTDASFLHQETAAAHMHIGGVLVFEGPAPTLQELTDHIAGRLHRIPRYRQRLAFPPLDAGRPLWIDDTSFNLHYHVRASALPAPGSDEQLMGLVSRIDSQPLDRSKPLWECYVISGIAPEPGGSPEQRFALIIKTHHALVDGISGVDLATVLFDFTQEPPAPELEASEPWQPHPEPTPAQLVVMGVGGAAGRAAGLALRATAGATRPERSVEAVKDAAEGVGDILWALLNPAPSTPLNVEIGPHRRFVILRHALDDYKLIKNALGGTVNDVFLAVTAGGLAAWLHSRLVRTEGLELRALVPVSVRTEDQHGQLGNKLTLMRGPLPVYVEDPVARLAVVRAAMNGLKESKQALGAATIASMNDLAPPAILAQASRMQFSTRLFNLLVTNVPGPQFPLYMLGRKLTDMFPLAFLPVNHALAVAIMSYNGRIGWGLLGDYDAMGDIDVIARGIESSLAALLEAAKRGGARRAARQQRDVDSGAGSGPEAGTGASAGPEAGSNGSDPGSAPPARNISQQ